MWRQRLRWFKGSHLFVVRPDSVLFKKLPHMSWYQKSFYWLCPIAHFVMLWAVPVILLTPCAPMRCVQSSANECCSVGFLVWLACSQ